MSHPASPPRSGIDGQTNAAQDRNGMGSAIGNEAERMPRFVLRDRDVCPVEMSVFAAGVGTTVRPGRVRNRPKTELDEKVKKPADGVSKKSPPARKAPARGRYVDEYARPAI